MKEITPLRDNETFEQLRQYYRVGYSEHWRESLATFIDYLLEQDSRWCEVSDHKHFEGQKRVRSRLTIMRERLFSKIFKSLFGERGFAGCLTRVGCNVIR